MIARLNWLDGDSGDDDDDDRHRCGPAGSPALKLLAIDSATERLALAAIETAPSPDIVAADLDGGATASRVALPSLLALVASRGWRLQDVGAVAYGQGPGGFTGLRTACAVAQGLAFGLGIPVLAVDSLCLVAQAARAGRPDAFAPGGVVWVAMDARMDEIYAACYVPRADGGWDTRVAPRLVEPGALLAAWQAAPPDVVADSAPAAFGARLPTGPAVVLAGDTGRAHALGQLAARAWSAGARRPADQALPLYLRDKVALTTVEREALRAARGPAP